MTFDRSSANRTITLMSEAARANREDARRMGQLIELPPHGDLMVVGDLHGNLKNYEAVLKIAKMDRAPQRHLILQELVHDFDVDSGEPCRSWQLVEMSARLKKTFPDRAHILLGNHEMAELCDLAIAKHGCELNERFRDGVHAAYGARMEDVFEAYRNFWRTLPLAARTAHKLFIVHSTPKLGKMGPFSLDWFRGGASAEAWSRRSPVFDLVWGRDYSQKAADEFARRVESELLLVGHTPARKGYASPNSRHVVLDSKDEGGGYAILPLDRPLKQSDVLGSIKPLFPNRVFEW